MKYLAIASTALLMTACTAQSDSPQSAADREAENPLATVAATGEARSCLPVSQLRQTEGVSSGAIIFEMNNGDLYRNELTASCPGARQDVAFSYSTPTQQLCRGTILTFFDPAVRAPYGSCALGEFVPIPKDARDMMKDEPEG